MENSELHHLPQHAFFRFPPSALPFQGKVPPLPSEGLGGHCLREVKLEPISPPDALPFQHAHLIPVSVSGAFSAQPQAAKASFSIDALLGLKEGGRGPTSAHGLPPHALNWIHRHPYAAHLHEHEPKSKSTLRYVPYKRERKTSQHGGGGEGKEVPGRSGGKAKRVRTIFTPEQLEKLESEFERQQYMVGNERSYLAESLDLTEAQVKVWFQNRRIKWRKVHLEIQQERLRALRSQEARQQSDESSASSEGLPFSDDFPLPRTGVAPERAQGEGEEGPCEAGKREWDPSPFDVDAYLLKTLGNLRPVPRWMCPVHGTSGSDSESD